MLRLSLGSAAVFMLLVGALLADDKGQQGKNKVDHKTKAKITHVDRTKGEITVQMKGKDGKEVEKTFHLTGEVFLYDDNGKTVRAEDIGIFRAGNQVLLVEREGKLREVHKEKNQDHKEKNADTKRGAGK